MLRANRVPTLDPSRNVLDPPPDRQPGAGALRAGRGHRGRVRRVRRLGPRPVGEFPAEILDACPQAAGAALERPDRYAALGRELVAGLGGTDWTDPARVVRLVAGGRA